MSLLAPAKPPGVFGAFDSTTTPSAAKKHAVHYTSQDPRDSCETPSLAFRCTKAPFSHEDALQCIGFASDSSRFCTAGLDSRLLVWDRHSSWVKLVGVAELTSKFSTACDIAPNSEIFGVGGLNNRCSLYKFDAEEPVMQNAVHEFTNPHHMLAACKFLNDETLICIHGDSFYHNSTASLTHVAIKRAHKAQITGLDVLRSFSQNFVTCSSDRHIKLWDTRMSQCGIDLRLTHELNCIKTCRLQPNILAVCYDNQVNIFDIRFNRSLYSFDADKNFGELTAVELSRNGRLVFVADNQGSLACYDVLSGSRANAKTADNATRVLYSPDNAHVMHMSDDGRSLVIGSAKAELFLLCPNPN